MIELPYGDHIFRTIYADPPWNERGGGKIVRGAQRHYDLMTTPEIKLLGQEVSRVAETNAHLYLWVTNNFMESGLEVMATWGFTYKTMISWFKDRIGLGQYFRGLTEHCLFGVRGNLPYRTTAEGKRAQGVTGFAAPRREHSVKPGEMRQQIELVSYAPFLELFARAPAPGWEAWGLESDGRGTQLLMG